ncbi:MAG: prolyl oligopeptidase family serine peptidase [Bacteroides sp.]|nr:prolyl oligopeptidase family serine peptidase [Bacteroides sp.]
MREVHEQYRWRQQSLATACQSPETTMQYAKEVRQRYLDILGEMPEKTPLQAEVTGVEYQPGFRMEKIVLQSMPGRYVTASLYLPEGEGKYAVTVSLCGHGIHGKRPGPAEVLLARNGITTLVVDPIGQGERWQFINEKGEYATRGATTEHTLLHAGCVAVGTSLAALQCWDNHRAIDYLVSREDIDADRIGVWGSSGGGTETTYLIGMDERVKVVAICSYFSGRERTLELQGPSDGCQHIPHEGEAGIELADFALMMAPKPVLILNGKYDFVDLWGAYRGVEELNRAYQVLGVPEHIRHVVTETGHGLGKEKRGELVQWFKRWFCNDLSPLTDDESHSLTLEQSFSTSTGQVSTAYADAVSIPDQNLIRYRELHSQREAFLNRSLAELQEEIGRSLRLPSLNIPVRTQLYTKKELRGYTQYHYEIIREGLLPIPCIIIIPDRCMQNKVEIILADSGKEKFLALTQNIQPYIDKGTILVAADLRGFGETEDPAIYNDAKYWNREYRLSITALHTGKPLIGQRVADLITLLDALESWPETASGSYSLLADRRYGPVALHTAVLDDRLTEVVAQCTMRSYTECMTAPMQYDLFSNMIYGVLTRYDLPDLVQLTEGRFRYGD